jgi:hypothetical protein
LQYHDRKVETDDLKQLNLALSPAGAILPVHQNYQTTDK